MIPADLSNYLSQGAKTEQRQIQSQKIYRNILRFPRPTLTDAVEDFKTNTAPSAPQGVPHGARRGCRVCRLSASPWPTLCFQVHGTLHVCLALGVCVEKLHPINEDTPQRHFGCLWDSTAVSEGPPPRGQPSPKINACMTARLAEADTKSKFSGLRQRLHMLVVFNQNSFRVQLNRKKQQSCCHVLRFCKSRPKTVGLAQDIGEDH